MKYWEYPEQGQGSHSYVWHSQLLSADFNHQYHWDRMLDSYGGSATNEEKEAVARLMSDVGISINMYYGPYGSGAAINANNPLATFFKYSTDVVIVYRSSYKSWSDWFDLYKNQLDLGWPVIDGSFSTTLASHAFVIDGYRIQNKINQVHVNLGWTGSHDNYYTIDDIYSYGSEMDNSVVNIHPPETMASHILTVESTPDPGVPIRVGPPDNEGDEDGNTNFTRTYNAGIEIVLSAPPHHNGLLFSKWTANNDDYSVHSLATRMNEDRTAEVVYSDENGIVVDLGEALENGSLTWTTSADDDWGEWFGRTCSGYVGGDSACSGEVKDYESSTVQTMVEGPGLLDYYWKVSSERDYDFLRLYIDDDKISEISGDVPWQRMSVYIPSGQRLIKWIYEKDVAASYGMDCGRLDKVEYKSYPGMTENFLNETFTGTPSDWTFNGDAYYKATEGQICLTENVNWQSGSAFYNQPVVIDQFTVAFDLVINGGGFIADGMTFAIVEQGPECQGYFGGGLGFWGITGRAMSIEFDSYRNDGYPEYDPEPTPHIGFNINGETKSVATAALQDLQNQGVIAVKIHFYRGCVWVALQGGPYPEETQVLYYSIPDWSPFPGYFGFTGATGGAGQENLIDNVIIDVTPPPEETIYFPRLSFVPGAATEGFGFVNTGQVDAEVNFKAHQTDGVVAGISDPMEWPAENQGAYQADGFLGLFQATDAWVAAETDQTGLLGFFLSQVYDNGLMAMDGADVSNRLVTDGIIPRVNGTGEYTTDIFLANPGLQATEVTITGYDGSGSFNGGTCVIDPLGFLRTNMQTLFGEKAVFSGYLRLRATGGIVGNAVIRHGNNAIGSVNLLPASEAGEDLVAPHITLFPGLYYTEVNLINPTNEEAEVTLHPYDAAGVEIVAPFNVSIPANQLVALSDLQLGLPPGINSDGWLEVESPGHPLLGCLTFGDPVDNSYESTLPLQTSGADDIYFAQVANGIVGATDFFTGVALVNASGQDVVATIHVFAGNGEELGNAVRTLTPGEKYVRLLRQIEGLEGLPDQSSGYLHIVADGPLFAFELFGDTVLNFLSAVPAQFNLEQGPGDLLAYYPFTGGPYDKSGNGRHGLVYGAVLTEDRFGREDCAYHFDESAYIQTGVDSNSLPLSFSAWFKADEIGGTFSIINSDIWGRYGHSLILGFLGGVGGDGSLNIECHDYFLDSGYVVLPDQWYHVVMVFSDVLQMYVNGELIIDLSYSPPAPDGSNFRIGRHNEADPYGFVGTIDDIYIYNRVLSDREVQALYTADK